MSGIEFPSIHFTQFQPPEKKSVLGLRSIVYWISTVCTLGIYPAATYSMNKRDVRLLQLTQKDLIQQFEELETDLKKVEEEFAALIEEAAQIENADEPITLTNRLYDQLGNKNKLGRYKLKPFDPTKVKADTLGRKILSFVGNLFFNLITLGLYAVVENNDLVNQAILLESQNQYLAQRFNQIKDKRLDNCQNLFNTATEHLQTLEQHSDLQQQYIAYSGSKKRAAFDKAMVTKAAADKKKEELDKHLKRNQELRASIEKYKNSADDKKNKFKEADSEVIELAKRREQMQSRLETLEKQYQKVREEVRVLNAQLLAQQKATKNEVQGLALKVQLGVDGKELAPQLQKAKEVEREAEALEKKIKDWKEGKNEMARLALELGPVPPRYAKRATDSVLAGALTEDNHFDANFVESYKKAYQDKRDASHVVAQSFERACDYLFDDKMKDLIALNKSDQTPYSAAMAAVYNYMVYDIVSGGAVIENGCSGYALAINEDVRMLPSKPEKVMQLKEEFDGKKRPVVELNYQQYDSFTLPVKTLGAFCPKGVDAPALRWILEQLTHEEKEILSLAILEPAIPHDHPEMERMKAFMKNEEDPRVQLIETAVSLIFDLGTAIKKKFEGDVLPPYFLDRFDEGDEPFVKTESNTADVAKVKNEAKLFEDRRVDWELDPHVVGDVGPDGKLRQSDFLELVNEARQEYQRITAYMGPQLLKQSYANGGELKNMTKGKYGEQYNIAHKMIGSHGCAFSALLTIFMVDSKELTPKNVQSLRNAMAAYLSKVVKDRVDWYCHPEKNNPEETLSPNALLLRDQARIADKFEIEIKSAHRQSIKDYQASLRSGSWGSTSYSHLEIDIAAHAMGVKVGLFYWGGGELAAVKVDETGRALPSALFLGPNTNDVFFMGTDIVGGTYYSLYPKLKIDDDNEVISEDPEAIQAFADVNGYWTSLNGSYT